MPRLPNINSQLNKDSQAVIDSPAQPQARILLMHGAGAPMQSHFMQQLTEQLVVQQFEVWRFNFAYMQRCVAGFKQPPPRLPKLMPELVEQLQQMPTDLPLLLAGKSMGARMAAMALTETEITLGAHCVGAVAYGYPFCPAATQRAGGETMQAKLAQRIGFFPQLRRPLLIIQGDRDAFGSKQLVANYPLGSTVLQSLSGADHDYQCLKSSGSSQQEKLLQAAQLSRDFLQQQLSGQIT